MRTDAWLEAPGPEAGLDAPSGWVTPEQLRERASEKLGGTEGWATASGQTLTRTGLTACLSHTTTSGARVLGPLDGPELEWHQIRMPVQTWIAAPQVGIHFLHFLFFPDRAG